MSIFRTPTDNFVTPRLAEFNIKGDRLSEEQRLANRLAVHRAATARGRNVFQLTDLSYTENQPSDMSTVVKVYYGGHDIVVDATEVASFTAAGYGAYIE
jgi:hypothetical protein